LKFTDAKIRQLQPDRKPYERFDETQPGLLIRVQPSGAKTFYLVYRNATNVRRRMRIGGMEISVSQARHKAKVLAAEATLGKDHVEERRLTNAERQTERELTLRAFLAGDYRIYAEEHLKRPEEAIVRVKYCFRDWLDKPLSSITDLRLRGWLKANSHKASTTLGSDLNRLSGVLTTAVNLGFLESHPLQESRRKRSGLRKPSPVCADKRVRYLSATERRRLFKALEDRDRQLIKARASHNEHRRKRGKSLLPAITGYGDFLHPLIVVALNTGLRRGELLNLEWDDVNLDLKQIMVRSVNAKSSRPRVVPLNSDATSALRRWRVHSGHDIVFTKHGTRLTHFKNSWRSLLELAQIEDFRFHDCRHDFASQLVMAGTDLYTVCQLLGHASTDTTQRYAHLSPDHLRSAVSVLGNEN
jgi:integrase